MADLVLFWHRRDLRLADNVGLMAACDRTPQVVGVFCLDPGILQGDDVAPARVAYLIGCLAELQQRYAEAGGQLLILQGDPRQRIPALAKALGATAVYWNRDVEPYSRQRDKAVVEALKEIGVGFETVFGINCSMLQEKFAPAQVSPIPSMGLSGKTGVGKQNRLPYRLPPGYKD